MRESSMGPGRRLVITFGLIFQMVVYLAAMPVPASAQESPPPAGSLSTGPTGPLGPTGPALTGTTGPAPTGVTGPTPTGATGPAVGLTENLIVKLRSGLSELDQAAVITRNGGVELSEIAPLRLHVVAVPAEALVSSLDAFRADPDIETADRDRVRDAEGTPNDAAYADQWALPQIGWDQAFGVVDPAGTATIAVLDTGVEWTVGDIPVTAGWSAFGTDPFHDPHGHGTALASIAAAVTDNSAGIAGVAYDGVSVQSVQVLDANGEGQDSDIIAGVVWAAENGADVILMGFSNPGFSSALQDAVDYAWSQGTVLVAATGNDASSSPTYPAGDAKVVGVSATDQTDALASFSNYGAASFIAAPGVGVMALETDGSPTSVTGTSASAAIVAGGAALLAADDSSASNGVIVGRLARNADPVLSTGQTGNGRLNLARALGDSSVEQVIPAGAPGGGPIVGPYVAAANNYNVAVTPSSVTAGSESNFAFVFTATNSGGGAGTGTISIPAGWTTPQTGAGPGQVTVVNGTCAAASLNNISSNTITFNHNCNNTQTFTVNYTSATAPTPASPPQTYTFNSTPVSGTQPTVTVTAKPTVTLSQTGSPIAEAGGTATVTATLSNTAGSTVTVSLGFSGTATNVTDYMRSATSITIPSGSTTGSITLTAVQDTLDEDNETIIVDITSATNATIGSPSQATVTITDDDALPTVQFTTTSSSGSEASTPANLEVSLSPVSGRTVTVNYTVTGGTATGGGVDHTLLGTGTLTFNAGDTTKNVQLSIVDDALDENNETVIVTLSSPSNAVLGANTVHTYTINDNDDAPTVQFATAGSSDDEAVSPRTFEVTLSAASGKTVTVDFDSIDGTALGGGTDYSLANGTLTFDPGDTSELISATIVDDALDEFDETFEIELSNPNNATLGTPKKHTATIEDNDATPTVEFDATSSSGDEGESPANLAVSLSAASGKTVAVDYAVTGGSADDPADYSVLGTGTLTFFPGDTTKNVQLSIEDDAIYEDAETVIVTLSNPTNATLGSNTVHTYTITNDDAAPVISIEATDSSLEGDVALDDTTIEFTVTKTGATDVDATVDFDTADGTAAGGLTCAAGTDYISQSGDLTFGPTETTKTITVELCEDTVYENDEDFTVELSNPGDATLGNDTGTGTITNDDAAPTLAIDDVTKDEGDSGTTDFTFTVTKTGDTELTATVKATTSDGTASGDLACGAGVDYEDNSATLTFDPTETTETFTVKVCGDGVFEADEDFTVTLSDETNATITDGTGDGEIANDDDAPTLAIDDVTKAEGNSGTTEFTFTVTKTGATALSSSVDFDTVAGTAIEDTACGAGIDYEANTGTLNFGALDTTKTIVVKVCGDVAFENDETFTVELDNATNATITDGTGDGEITNDDDAPTLAIDDVTKAEGNSGTTEFTFTVTKTGATALSSSVDFDTVAGTAIEDTACGAGIDYEANTGTLNFGALDTTKTIVVKVCGDAAFENDETFTVELDNATNATITDGTGDGEITNDDDAPTLAIDDVTKDEGNSGTTDFTFTVTKTGATALSSSVDFATAAGTAIEGAGATCAGTDDYLKNSGTLNFGALDTSKTIVVKVCGDAAFEADETFQVKLSNATNATIGDDTGLGTIKNDDANYTVMFQPPLDGSTTTPSRVVINAGKNGRVIPVKVKITLGGSEVTPTNAGGVVTIEIKHMASCSSGDVTDSVESYGAAGNANTDNLFRYSSGFWIYNWDTSASGLLNNNCYRINVYVNGVKATVNEYAVFKPTK